MFSCISWKMFSIEVLCLTVVVLSIKYNAEPIIEQGPACESKLKLSCSSSISSSYGFWTFFRYNSYIENIAKIIYSDNGCTVKAQKIYLIDCRCIQGYVVNCIISNSTVGNTSERWYCSKFSGESTNVSAEIRLVPQDMSECTTAIDPENFTEDGQTLTTVLNINKESMTNTQAAAGEQFTTVSPKDEVVSLTNTSLNKTVEQLEIQKSEMNTNDYFRHNFIIISVSVLVVLVIIFIVAAFVMRVYWKSLELQAVISHPLDVPNTSLISENMRQSEDVTVSRERYSLIDHYDRIPVLFMAPMADSFPLSGETIELDNVTETEDEHGSIHYETVPDTQFNALGGESSTRVSGTVRYEDLLQRRIDEKYVYTTLASSI